MASPVDISYTALEYLASIGYARVQFILSEMNHTTPDICDKVAGRFSSGKFVTLSSILQKAPVFGANPPAPIYGLTHPLCRCHYIVYPPNTAGRLKLPGQATIEQKKEILRYMYPQEIWALSKVPKIRNIDFSQFVDVLPASPPVPNNELKTEPWYAEAWKWVKGKVFRKASDYSDFVRLANIKMAVNNVRLGDLVKFISDTEFVSEFGISTPISRDFIGLALGDLDERRTFVYIANYNTVLPVDKSKLIQISNKDIDSQFAGKKARIFNKSLGDEIECIIHRQLGDTAMIYDFIDGDLKQVPISEVKLVG